MSGKQLSRNEVSVDEQANERREDEIPVEAGPELRASVEQEFQGKVDTNHPDATPEGLTLEAEERLEAREREIERTRRRWDSRQDSDREARTRRRARRGSAKRRRTVERRAASVDGWADPDRPDPRALLTRDELGTVNQKAADLARQFDGWTRAAISRRLAERVVDGVEVTSAVLQVIEELQRSAAGTVPIGDLEAVSRREVDVKGRVVQLWDASSSSIQQVGLIEDGSGRTKFTIWRKSGQPLVQEGDEVVLRSVAKNWYQGRVSVALTGRSRIEFPERGRWWA